MSIKPTASKSVAPMPDRPQPSDGLSSMTFLFYAGLLILLWGSAFTMISVGVRYIDPLWFVAYRLILGAGLVCLYGFWKGHRFPPLTDQRWLWYILLGITAAALPFFLIATGQKTVDSGLSAIMVGTMPLFTIALAHFFVNEPMNGPKVIGFIFGFIGIVLLFLPDDFKLTLIQDWKAQLLIMGAAFCYALSTIIAKRAPDTPATVGAAMMLLCAAFTVTLVALFERPPPLPPLMGITMIAGLGICATAVATILYLYMIQKTGPTAIARINFFVPAVSVSFGIFLLGEPFSWRIVISFAIIALGVFISRLSFKKGRA